MNDSNSIRRVKDSRTGDNRKHQFSVIILSVFLLALVFSILNLSGCATRYYPQPADRITIVENYAILETDGIAFAVTPRVWTREPQRISDYFTTFHVVIRNQSDQPVTISPSDINLLDEERNQFEVMTASEVGNILFYDDFMRDKFTPLPERIETYTGDRISARANLMQEAFHYGEIFPGARKSGFIFFRRLPARNRMSTILFRGEEIVFIRG